MTFPSLWSWRSFINKLPKGSEIKVTFQWCSQSREETLKLGQVLGEVLEAGSIIALIGDLGTGKTTFTKGVVQGLGGSNDDEVTSPSFVLVNQYEGRLPVYHLDLYRLEDERELNDLGWEDFTFSAGVTLIEWAEKIIPFLPPEYLEVNFQWLDQNTRELTFVGHGEQGGKIINIFKRKWKGEK